MTWQQNLWRGRVKRKSNTRRDEILEHIIEYAETYDGPTPNINEIAQALGMGYATAYNHIMKLMAEGRLVRNADNKLIVPDSDWIPPQR